MKPEFLIGVWSNAEMPLSFQANATYFKVYMSDVGLLRKKSGVSWQTILEDSDLYRNFKGAFTENYVLTELITQEYCKKYSPEIGFKLSLKNVGDNIVGKTDTISLPLYLIWMIKKYCSKGSTMNNN